MSERGTSCALPFLARPPDKVHTRRSKSGVSRGYGAAVIGENPKPGGAQADPSPRIHAVTACRRRLVFNFCGGRFSLFALLLPAVSGPVILLLISSFRALASREGFVGSD